jgi:hypothetical protein
MTTRDDLVTQLAAIERLLTTRVIVVRIVIDAQGNELYRITRPVPRPTQQRERIYD